MWEEICPEPTPQASSLIGPILKQACCPAADQQVRRGRGCPATLSWAHLALAVVLHLIEGWQSRLEIWRCLRS
jgi:hypothetical protein